MALSKTTKQDLFLKLSTENKALRKILIEKDSEIEEEREAKELLNKYHEEDFEKAFSFAKKMVLLTISNFGDSRSLKNKIISIFQQLVNDDVINRNVKKYAEIIYNPILTEKEKQHRLNIAKKNSTDVSNIEYIAATRELKNSGIFTLHPEFRKFCDSNINIVQILEFDSFGVIEHNEFGPFLKLNTESAEYKEYLYAKSINGIACYLLQNDSFYDEFVQMLSNKESEKIKKIA